MNFVLGSRGRLGGAIVSSFESSQVTALDRSVYSDWWHDGAADHVSRFFESRADSKGVVYLAAGLIDPKAPVDEHHRVNFLLARNVIEGAANVGLRTVTFGTVMETVIGDKPTNPYFSSKTKLGHFVSDFSVKSNLALHIRMHTLYGGGLPDGFMFLGQLLNSITSHTRFNMSPGAQLREYHHIDDEIAAIAKLVEAELSGTVELSHGEPVKLRDLATYVFEQLKCPELLNIGALSEPANDNYTRVFERTPLLRDFAFRDTLPAIVEYLRLCKTALGQ
jgi:nucleoside-diphosphate-sugar epimerase